MLEFQPGILYNKSCSDFIKIKIIEQENCRFCVEYAGGGTGGEIVAQETLERIRQAEEKAEAIEQEGKRQAQELLQNGKAEAAAKEKRLTQEAIERGQEQIRKAEQEAKAVLSRADANAAKAIEALRAQAKQNEQAAVEAVLRRLA